ncbi:DUF1499 domain-containing protein [Aureimonas jatrophae]|jgi:hypothetical protein|uniref:DUF1499 domain-containing protein n=1 Tax=Aureimonas jatrophae TaxID=1166073 RepID=A0A1H0GPX8_9HYPH|nr:DUF1499 domain-containing protein [Aureimonas jatrophae]MBB3949697.1 hypothetical protein [Aureimonas jatrophae]SDO08955.1 Protein of unknown function [Aureimonas jatrophae]
MAGHYIVGRTKTADWAWSCAAFAPAVMISAIVLFRLTVLDEETLSWSFALAAALVAAGFVLALVACGIVWHRGKHGGGRATAALTVALVAAAPFALLGWLYSQYPTGNSAATTGLEQPVTSGDPNGGVRPLVGRDFQATASTVYGAARTAFEGSGIAIVDVGTSSLPRPAAGDLGVSGLVTTPVPTPRDSIDPTQPFDRFAGLDATDYTIQGVATVPILGSPSDVVVRIQEDNGETYVDMTSRSRTLPLDLGQNRRIIEGFMARLEEAMNVLEGVTPEE